MWLGARSAEEVLKCIKIENTMNILVCDMSHKQRKRLIVLKGISLFAQAKDCCPIMFGLHFVPTRKQLNGSTYFSIV